MTHGHMVRRWGEALTSSKVAYRASQLSTWPFTRCLLSLSKCLRKSHRSIFLASSAPTILVSKYPSVQKYLSFSMKEMLWIIHLSCSICCYLDMPIMGCEPTKPLAVFVLTLSLCREWFCGTPISDHDRCFFRVDYRKSPLQHNSYYQFTTSFKLPFHKTTTSELE